MKGHQRQQITIMRSVLALSAAAVLAAHTSSAFICPSSSSHVVANSRRRDLLSERSPLQPSILLANRNSDDDDESLVPSLTFLKDNPPKKKQSVRRRIKQLGLQTWERMDTLRAAGLYDDDSGLVPMQSGFKMNVGLLVGAFLFKWYRARFITKVCI